MSIRQLGPELTRIAQDELSEEPQRLKEDLQHIKDWVSKQPHLRARTDEQWLVAFLRGCKFSLEKTKKKLDLYYTLRTTASDVTLRLKPGDPKFLEIVRLGTSLILPKSKDPTAPRILFLRPVAFDPNKYHVAEIICVFYYLVQILVIEDDSAQVVGVKTLVDAKGTTVAHIAQMTPALLKKIVFVTQDAMPLRLKGSHHINLPSSVETVFSLLKSLLNEKARQRFKVHKNYEDLHQSIPKEILPAEYGGGGGTVAEIAEHWAKKIEEYKNYMQQEINLGTDESKRPGKPSTAAEMFGVEGSFRKLELD